MWSLNNRKTPITFNRGIQSLFETYRQHFYRFANLALNFIKVFFAKIQIALSCFCKAEIPMKFTINGKYYTYVIITKRKSLKRSRGVARKREKKK